MDAPGTQFDAIQWINCYLRQLKSQTNLEFEQMKPVLYFSLMWNMFEDKACGRHARRTSIVRSVRRANQTGRLRRDRYLELLRFFQERPVATGQDLDSYLDTLFAERPDADAQKAIQTVLLGESDDLEGTVRALLLFAHRIRCNLFHGNKAVADLPRQTDLFVEVNWLLATYLEDLLGLPMRNAEQHLHREADRRR